MKLTTTSVRPRTRRGPRTDSAFTEVSYTFRARMKPSQPRR